MLPKLLERVFGSSDEYRIALEGLERCVASKVSQPMPGMAGLLGFDGDRWTKPFTGKYYCENDFGSLMNRDKVMELELSGKAATNFIDLLDIVEVNS